MRKTILILSLLACAGGSTYAQRTPHASMALQATMGTPVPFDYYAVGTPFRVRWGMDTAWDNLENVRRGTNHIGKDCMATGRISFQPSDLVDADGNLSDAQKSALRSRVNHIKQSGVKTVMMNCDHEALNAANYKGKPTEWARVIKASVKYAQSLGVTVESVAPFNEPDYSAWNEGSKLDFLAIAMALKNDPDMEGIRICGGNTLNCDEALPWYNVLKTYLDEGNTHQLAGSFDSYASFFQTVRADGKVATADELHNVMEAMVGVEYGMQNGVWWGYDGVARGQFCRANTEGGSRLAYAEDRASWTAASVYRQPEGAVNAFLGTSERQANTHTYDFLSQGSDVYFDGYGPLRSYGMTMPGGTGYQQGQTNAERLIRINTGEDVQPYPIEADTFVIMNKYSKRVLQIQGTSNGTAVTQGLYKPAQPQKMHHWIVDRVSDRTGGDFSYITIRSLANTSLYLDLLNWSVDTGGTLCAYSGTVGANEQWYVEYAGDGDFYIRSRHSGLCLQPRSKTNGAVIEQAVFKGTEQQRWRFMPMGAACELDAPAAPQGLKATPQTASIRLSWTPNNEEDLGGYTVLRGERQADNSVRWTVIGRQIQGTTFVDNGANPATAYLYKVKATDRSCNTSLASDSIEAQTLDTHALIAQYEFDGALTDTTANLFDAAVSGTASYSKVLKKSGTQSLLLNGTSQFVQLPHQVGNLRELSVATWVNLKDVSNTWQRIFDFGNGTSQYMFLTPSNGNEMRFVIKDVGDEQILSAPRLSSGWHHVAVTIGAAVTLYVDGNEVASSTSINIRPADFHPVLNYIGRSQYDADPLLKANIDDFRIYNYELSANEVSQVMNGQLTGINSPTPSTDTHIVATDIYSADGRKQQTLQPGVNIVIEHYADGHTVQKKILGEH